MENEKTYVFESVVFQQILNELVRFSDYRVDNIVASILEIEEILKPLNPMIFYLKTGDLKAQIDKVAQEHLSDNYELYPDWIDWMVECTTQYHYKHDKHQNTVSVNTIIIAAITILISIGMARWCVLKICMARVY